MKTCYVSTTFGKKQTSAGQMVDFNHIYFDVVKPAVESTGLQCMRGDELKTGDLILKSIFNAVLNSDIMIADLTIHNANVLYELGIRHTARRGLTILLSDVQYKLPYDLVHTMAQWYELDSEGKLSGNAAEELRTKITKAIGNGKTEENTSPLYEFFPDLNVALPIQS
jgi:hypothetical protein